MANVRKKGKSYEIRVFCGVASNGKRIEQYKTWRPSPGMTPKQIEKELEKQKVLFEEAIKTGIMPDSNIRFDKFIDRWIEEYAKVKLAHKTYSRYLGLIARIKQGLGHIKLKDLKPLHINAFLRNLEEDGMNLKTGGKLAPKTVLEHYRLIRKLLATAVKWQLLEQNVAIRADPPKVPYKESKYLNKDQTLKMFELLENEPIKYKTMIILLVYTGIRRGELCGLEWKDIDFENRTMHIVRSSQYIGNATIITKEPKTKSSIRKISLSNTACILLRQYKAWQNQEKLKLGDRWTEHGRLFTQWDGNPISPDTITDWFGKFIKRSNLPHVTLHSLRHTNATLMIAEGTDVCTVSQRLGHSNTSTTLNIYAHALKSKDQEAAKMLDNLLGESQREVL
jgi:integrase